jgi:hypothetical protein
MDEARKSSIYGMLLLLREAALAVLDKVLTQA